LIFLAPEATLQSEEQAMLKSLSSVGRSGGFSVADHHQVHDLTPDEVSKGIAEGRYLLVDVREPNEVAVEAYPDAVVVPLSGFDPQDIPDPEGRQVVFACRSGKRSVTASLAAQADGLAYDKHLAGGMLAWKAAGLPTRTG
jgi:rhodanese-related sulfurtransferase